MFKKVISSLLIISIFSMDVASAMKHAGGGLEEGNREGNRRTSPPRVNETRVDESSALLIVDNEENGGASGVVLLEELIPSHPTQDDPELGEQTARLLQIEKRPFFLKWTSIDHLPEKMLYALWLRKENTTPTPPECCGSRPLWIKGLGVPLRSGFSAAREISEFRQGVKFVLDSGLSLILQGLVGYQVYEFASSPTHPSFGGAVTAIADIFLNGNEKSIRGALAVVVQNPENAPYFFSLFAAPVVWGLINALLFARGNCSDSTENFRNVTQIVEDSSRPCAGKCKSFWKDYVRWFLPCHAFDQDVKYLVHHLLLDGALSTSEREAALKALIAVARNTSGFSKAAGLNALYKLTVGTHHNQLAGLDDVYGNDYTESLAREKARALFELCQQNPGLRKAGKRGQAHNLYAHYLRWALGDFRSKKSAVAWALVTGGMIGLKLNLFYKIAQQIYDYLQCPKPLQQGFNAAMHPTGYSLYNQKCFEAYLRVFNKIPGQPASTLVGLMPQFTLDPSYTLFNLSGAGVTGEQVAGLLLGLRTYHPTIHLTQFDLSYNAINTESGMMALLEAFQNITLSSLVGKGIQVLNLSNNQMGDRDDRTTFILGTYLSCFPSLQTLDLSQNGIGNGFNQGDDGTIAIGEGLSHLPLLQTLDLSMNFIGSFGDDGTIAIGEGLQHLSRLQTLDLSQNWIGSRGDDGPKAIGEGLQYLPLLQTLDLSGNLIGFNGDDGTIAIGEGLSHLPLLQTLDLSSNWIGGDDGTIAIGEGLSHLPLLQTLDLSYNDIGAYGDDGTKAIGEGLQHLSLLQTLDLSENDIGWSGDNETVANITHSIRQLKTLTSLFIRQRTDSIPSSQWMVLQQYWNHRTPNTDIYALYTTQDVQNYLDNLSNTTDGIFLSRNFPYPSADLVTLLFEGLSRFPNLQTLDLSQNSIGFNGDDGTIAIGEGLSHLPLLQTLDLSYNDIGAYGDDGTKAIGEGLQHLPLLQTLDLSFNDIGDTGDDGTTAIGEGLQYLPLLQTLDLSQNGIGRYGVDGTAAIGAGLQYLPLLQTLDLSQNVIGWSRDDGIKAIGEGLQHLPRLQILDLSSNSIGWYGDDGIQAIGEGLSHLLLLQTLDLSGNGIGNGGNNGTAAIGAGLQYLSLLQTLDLSQNWIGFYENGPKAIGEGLQHLPLLQTLDLSQNRIDKMGAQSLFNVLPQMICNGLNTLNLQGNSFIDIPWSETAGAMEGLYSGQIQQACEADRCFGTPVDVCPVRRRA